MLAVTFTTAEALSVAVPAALAFVAWASWLTKMVWDIRTDTSSRAARVDTTLDDHEERLNELERLFPRHVPNPQGH